MEDCCVGCYRHLATVSPACGHRLYCTDCFQRSIQNRATCGICNQFINFAQDTTVVQLRPTTLSNNIDDFNDLRIDYPFGFILMGTNEEIVDQNMYIAVQEAMAAVNANRLQLDQLKRALRSRLTMHQYQLVFVKFVDDINFHDVLRKLDRRQFERREYTRTVRRLVVHAIESADNTAILVRASTTAAIGSVGTVGTVVGALGHYGDMADAFNNNGVSTLIVFGVFTALEIYRWSKGSISGVTAVKNIGEHAVGSLGGVVGFGTFAYTGALAGTIILPGGAGIVIGAALGGVLGSIFSDYLSRKAYRKVFPGEEVEETEEEVREHVQLSQREVVSKAAEKFGINVDVVGFAEAQGIFRRMLLDSHPDKNPGISEEEKGRLTDETRDIIACWLIVREYYNDKGEVQESDCDEAFIKVWALKVYDNAINQWRTVRTFFENISLGREVNPQTERLEQAVIYV